MTGPEHAEAAMERITASTYAYQKWGEGRPGACKAAMWELAVAQVHALLAVAAGPREVSDRTDGLIAPLNGSSRKIGREWCRVVPGVQARLISFAGQDGDAYAWIETRPEPTP